MGKEDKKGVQKIHSPKDLQQIKEKVQKETALREDGFKTCITVHMGTCGIASGARKIITALMEEMAISGREDIRLTTSGCIGACTHEPTLSVQMLDAEPVLYGELGPEEVRQIFREHIIGGKVVPQHVISFGRENK